MNAKETQLLNSIIATTEQMGERTCLVDINGKVIHVTCGGITEIHQFLPPWSNRDLAAYLATARN